MRYGYTMMNNIAPAPLFTVRIGNGKTIHLAHGEQIDAYTLATDAVLCGTGPVANSWPGTIAAQKGETARLQITPVEPTCKRCIAAAEAVAR